MRSGGFTLVEIAIVLVIVGLLIGGVLKGREMITNARIKRVESDHTGISVAAQSYQDRYGVLPGDDPAAESRFDAYSAGDGFNGDGNGEIGAGSTFQVWDTPPPTATENNGFWAHLRASGLMDGAATNRRQPTNAFGGMTGVQARAYYTDFTDTYMRHAVMFGRIPGDVARILEERFDEGRRDAGNMRARVSVPVGSGQWPAILGSDPSSYLDDETYDIGLNM